MSMRSCSYMVDMLVLTAGKLTAGVALTIVIRLNMRLDLGLPGDLDCGQIDNCFQ